MEVEESHQTLTQAGPAGGVGRRALRAATTNKPTPMMTPASPTATLSATCSCVQAATGTGHGVPTLQPIPVVGVTQVVGSQRAANAKQPAAITSPANRKIIALVRRVVDLDGSRRRNG